MIKIINERCPFADECERKRCEFKFEERNCSYYAGNCRPDCVIDDQQALTEHVDIDKVFEEMQTAEIEYIDIEDIEPHPDNPRKNIGDISELAASIKANGVLQNLTVVKGVDKPYRALIGHKRLAAAKLAGVHEVPCVFTSMDYKTQIAIMLQENMLRTDLTAYEQAQAFGQLQFDLGASLAEISDMTGMSQSTVKRRLNLLDLDADEFKASQERGATLSDYLELEKISDINVRNDVLKKAGTTDFKWVLKSAIQKERENENKAQWLELIDSFADEIDATEGYKRERLAFFHVLDEITDDDMNEIAELKVEAANSECKKLYWYFTYGYAYIVGQVKSNDNLNDTQRAEAEARRRNKIAEISAIERKAYELRRAFVLSYNGKKEHMTIILKALLKNIDWLRIDEGEVSALLGIPDIGDNDEEFNILIAQKPQKVLIAYFFHIMDCGDSRLHTWQGEFNRNEDLEQLYGILEDCGYEISTEERQLIDGTHPVFVPEAEMTQPE